MSRVHLAVYDLSRGMAMAMSRSILGQQIDGIWHTGIVVFGNEYYFGGGIQVSPTGAFSAQNGMQPVQMQDMGETARSQAELEAYLRTINSQYTQATYDLINNNCNNFANTICTFLTGHGIPTHIVDLPRIVFSTPGGAMLRPMVEGMQNSIRQQGAGMDPFGSQAQSAAPHPAVHPPSHIQPFESALSHQLTDAAHRVAPRPVPAKKAELEEKPLVSGDASTVRIIANKILNQAGAHEGAEKGSALTAEEKAIVESIVLQLTGSGALRTSSFPAEAYSLLERVLCEFPPCHMAVLFVLRLMLLQDTASDYSGGALHSLLSAVIVRLTTYPSDSAQLSSIPAYAMAVCCLSNLLSHPAGQQCLLVGTHTTAAGARGANCDAVVDIVLAGVAHTRGEIRQMSATLAYNYTLACSAGGKLSGVWAEGGQGELHPHALQLLCCCLEGIVTEADVTVRRRRLATVLRVFRAYGKTASDFVLELGFADLLEILACHNTTASSAGSSVESPKLTADETAIVTELVAAYH